jgi:hypothetical protein
MVDALLVDFGRVCRRCHGRSSAESGRRGPVGLYGEYVPEAVMISYDDPALLAG